MTNRKKEDYFRRLNRAFLGEKDKKKGKKYVVTTRSTGR